MTVTLDENSSMQELAASLDQFARALATYDDQVGTTMQRALAEFSKTEWSKPWVLSPYSIAEELGIEDMEER